jgi:hypothetical protein
MTRRDLALSLLQDAGPRGVTTSEFMNAGVGSRYSARVRELRQAGWSITSERIREGSWRYTLEPPLEPLSGPRWWKESHPERDMDDTERGVASVPLPRSDSPLGAVPRSSESSPPPDQDGTRLFELPSRYDELAARSGKQ